MHKIVPPLPDVLPPITPAVGTKAMKLISEEVAIVIAAIRPFKLSRTVFRASGELSDKLSSIRPDFSPLPMLQIELPLSIVLRIINLHKQSLPMLHSL
jgi:hypothetical protein